MPKVIELLVRHEYKGQIWFSTQPVRCDPEDLPSPHHMEKGVRASPFQIDNFHHREPK